MNMKSQDKQIASMRQGFGKGLVKIAGVNEKVVALVPDLTNSVGFGEMAKKYPDRFIQVGIAEQNIVCVASGLAHEGLIPFVGAYAMFSPGRNWEQIRTTICLNNQPVKLLGSHAGLTVGPDGGTHQALEDMALMRVLPNMVVIAPGDAIEAEQVAIAMMRDSRPNYARVPRAETPIVFSDKHQFKIGKIYPLKDGNDMVILSTGTMTAQVLEANKFLMKHKINAKIIHCPTIKPLDEKAIIREIKGFDRIVTVEEHQIAGGFGSAISEVLTTYPNKNYSRRLLRIGVNDEFGQSGDPEDLLDFYGLSPKKIALQIIKNFK